MNEPLALLTLIATEALAGLFVLDILEHLDIERTSQATIVAIAAITPLIFAIVWAAAMMFTGVIR